jgi:hypothetical protein
MTEYDNIVVAAQEHAAKTRCVFSFSLQKMADALSAERLALCLYKSYISRLRYR